MWLDLEYSKQQPTPCTQTTFIQQSTCRIQYRFFSNLSQKFDTKNKIPLFTGHVPMPSKNEPIIGGHYMLLCGYDDTKQHFIVQNSLSTLVGDSGYFYFPYKYIKLHTHEFFTFKYAE